MKSINTNKSNIVTQDFDKDCRVIDLKYEYDGFTGETRYAIITDLSESELVLKYERYISGLRPYILLSREMGVPILLYWRNEYKFAKRYARGDVNIAFNKDDEAIYSELSVMDEQSARSVVEAEDELRQKYRAYCNSKLLVLTDIQRRYFIDHYVNNKSLRQIAREEGKNYKTIYRQVRYALIKLDPDMDYRGAIDD